VTVECGPFNRLALTRLIGKGTRAGKHHAVKSLGCSAEALSSRFTHQRGLHRERLLFPIVDVSSRPSAFGQKQTYGANVR
jgi:hypothetical protein